MGGQKSSLLVKGLSIRHRIGSHLIANFTDSRIFFRASWLISQAKTDILTYGVTTKSF